MRAQGSLRNDAEANAASREALRGVAIGAGRWSIPMVLLAAAGQVMSPIYRGLTIQFKIFIIMSGMVIGGWIEGDRRLRRYEEWMRVQRRLSRDEAVWRQYEIQEAKAIAKEMDRIERGKREDRAGDDGEDKN